MNIPPLPTKKESVPTCGVLMMDPVIRIGDSLMIIRGYGQARLPEQAANYIQTYFNSPNSQREAHRGR